MRSRKKKPPLPIKMLGRLEKGGVYILKLTSWNGAEYLDEVLEAWFKIFDEKKLDITILVLSPDMQLLDGRKLKKLKGDPPTEGAGSSLPCATCVLDGNPGGGCADAAKQGKCPTPEPVMVTNVDGNRVPKGSEADDRWGPYGTQRKKPVNVNTNPAGEMFTTP